jgi:hypothetical protein
MLSGATLPSLPNSATPALAIGSTISEITTR